jgi:flavin reductase (DIM6/NTAB) family NADH-FMN oxidoreductase RutF
MEKQNIAVRDLELPPFTTFDPNGLLLVSGQNAEHANVMTISWGMFGIMWSRPVVMVMVRPTRYTWDFITQAPDFTVNWMGQQWTKAVQLCGATSGRDVENKFTAAGLHAVHGQQTESPVIKESILSLECRVIYRDVVRPESFIEPGLSMVYEAEDYHGLFYGEIVAAVGTEYYRRA